MNALPPLFKGVPGFEEVKKDIEAIMDQPGLAAKLIYGGKNDLKVTVIVKIPNAQLPKYLNQKT